MYKQGFLTIGYGNVGLQSFVQELKNLRVNCIVDVRTVPYSKYNLSFNKEELRARLSEDNISYFWLGNKLGGRYDKISLCNGAGIVDYEKVANSEKFKEGINELLKLIKRYNICVMCSEKDPLKCHRFLLISRYLKEYNIYHVMPDFSLVKNSSLEERLFKIYGNLNQLSIFEEDNQESFENKVYRVQSEKTAYVSKKVKELLENGITEDMPEKVKLFTIGCENKTAEEFFTLLRDYKVKRLIDVRMCNLDLFPAFASYPDIAYYCRINQIEYERKKKLVPSPEDMKLLQEGKISFAAFSRNYLSMLEERKILTELMSEELSGTCFLGYEKDAKKSYRSLVPKALRKNLDNVTVRHLK